MKLQFFSNYWLFVALSISALSVLIVYQPMLAYAAEPSYYIGQHIEGYRSSSGNTWDAVSHIYGSTNFGTSYPSSLQDHLLSIVSTAGWNTNTNTVTGILYQFPITLQPNGLVENDAQVWRVTSDIPVWECFSTGCPALAQYSSLNYVRYTMYWPTSSRVDFLAEGYLNGGGYVYNIRSYNKVASDTSNAFSVGYVPRVWNNHNYYAKLFQVGVEAHTQEINWQVKQWDISYRVIPSGVTKYLVNDNTFSNFGATFDSDGSDMGKGSELSWDPATGLPTAIGVTGTLNADALYYNKPGSGQPPGTVLWYPNPTPLTFGKALWGKGSLHAISQNIGNHKAIEGLYAAVRDSGGNVIATGYTPLNIIVQNGGTYYVDYTNYGNFYFTRPFNGAKSAVTDYNVVNWGAPVKISITNKDSFTVGGRYYNHGEPAGYSRLTMESKYTNGNSLNGMYVALQFPGTSTPQTKGYTPYTVGVGTTFYYDAIWGNYVQSPPNPSYYYQYADPGVGLVEVYDNKYSWGGVQNIQAPSSGAYTDVGKYLNTP
ncbi:hypothetical protein [Nitrososphaera sp.]|uniref:hypothetical protein n=1 Tax=Nitrososphaera sp. TaxID=1971748 RepID=UPI00307F1D12